MPAPGASSTRWGGKARGRAATAERPSVRLSSRCADGQVGANLGAYRLCTSAARPDTSTHHRGWHGGHPFDNVAASAAASSGHGSV
eukprot:CAMPEP_0115701236 /NCGR_PEP_ID=MMETSP0272-20121206/67846_1 /TAXON_ID=71861 /ORGANISM="Scrippsiella trochoidea, Strain CCMP3099" /LENGTH=85 /DNA_ID=CAMNT_0003141797 /DNA_START=97 /DNA_END=354 /DNA_ORIENTATION=+